MGIEDLITGAPRSRFRSGPSALAGTLPGDPLTMLVHHVREHPRVDAGVFLVVDAGSGTIEPAATWFASPAVRDAVIPALWRSYDRDAPGLVETVLERSRPLLLPRVESWEAAPLLRAQIEREAHGSAEAVWEAFAAASLIACPVRGTLGRTLGLLVLASLDPGRPLQRGDVYTATALADLAALARERAELAVVDAARAREGVLLKRAAEDAAASLEIPEVEQHVVEHALGLVQADRAVLSRAAPGAAYPTTAAVAGDAPQGEPSHTALAAVSRARSPLVDGAALHVPVELGPRLFGVLSVFRAEGPYFGDHEADLLSKLARGSAAALANAIDFERERRIAGALTRGFVPDSLPNLEGWEFGLLYEPAARQPAGGDVYGAWKLPGGAVGVLVGDVAGKGVETAALSAMARFFIEARSWHCESPAQTLRQANTMLRDRLPSDTFVTAFFGLLTPDGLRYANAGHLSPLVLRPGEEPGELEGHGLALGIDEDPACEDRELRLGPGDAVLAFSDGLVEARRAGEIFGVGRLRPAAAEAAAGTMQELVGRVHQSVREWSGGVRDDAVLLALRRR